MGGKDAIIVDGDCDLEAAVEGVAVLVHTQRQTVGAELFQKFVRAAARVADDPDFGYHDRPAKNGADEQEQQNQLARQRGLAEREEQRVHCQQRHDAGGDKVKGT